jgi:hypothetical protein
MKTKEELALLSDEEIQKEVRTEVTNKWSNGGTAPVCEFMGMFMDEEINERIKIVTDFKKAQNVAKAESA